MDRIQTLVIPTCNRVEALERTLLSYIAHAKASSRDVEFIVADDSASGAYRQRSRLLLGSLARAQGVRVAYAGLEEKRAFCETLARSSGVDSAVIAFGLLGSPGAVSTGANRNVLLLETVGRLFYSVDDDTFARVSCAAGVDDTTLELHPVTGTVWDGYGAPADFTWRFFPSLEIALKETIEQPEDIFARHEQLLGRRVKDLKVGFENVLRRGHAPALAAIAPQFQPSGETSRVMLTMTGLLGDVGVDERWHLLANAPELLSQHGDESLHRLTLDSRIILRSPKRTTLTRWVGLHGMFFAADNRTILPPFFPLYRGQDSLMGWMARQCYPRDLFGFIPRALLHAPPPKSYARGYEFLLCSLSMADILIDLVKSEREWSSPEAALGAMSRTLLEAGKAPLPDLVQSLRQRWHADDHPWLMSHIASLRGPGLERLRACLRNVVETKARFRAEHDGSLPLDVGEGRSADDAHRATQAFIRQFGELVAAWPAMVEGCRQLQARGIRIARSLS